MRSIKMLPTRDFRSKNMHRLKVRGRKKGLQQLEMKRNESRVAVLKWNKILFKTKTVTRNKAALHIMIKRSVQQGYMPTVNIYKQPT